MAIYVKFAEEKKPKSIKEFLNNLYTKERVSYYARAVDTFTDKNCTQLQSSHMYRSFDDLLILTKTYYPSITTKKFIKILLNLKIPIPNSDKYYYPYLGSCSTMGKIRFIPYKGKFLDSYQTKMPNSKYTWEELLKPLGIKDTKTLTKYLEENEK